MVNIHAAKTHLSKLVERASRGEHIILAKAGKPIAKIVPLNQSDQERKPGLFKGKLEVTKDWDENVDSNGFYDSKIDP